MHILRVSSAVHCLAMALDTCGDARMVHSGMACRFFVLKSLTKMLNGISAGNEPTDAVVAAAASSVVSALSLDPGSFKVWGEKHKGHIRGSALVRFKTKSSIL